MVPLTKTIKHQNRNAQKSGLISGLGVWRLGMGNRTRAKIIGMGSWGIFNHASLKKGCGIFCCHELKCHAWVYQTDSPGIGWQKPKLLSNTFPKQEQVGQASCSRIEGWPGKLHLCKPRRFTKAIGAQGDQAGAQLFLFRSKQKTT